MSTSIENRVSYRLFVGCQLTSQIRMYLNQSKIWQQAAILPAETGNELVEAHHQGKDYLGRYLATDKVDLATLKEMTVAIRGRLHAYCPDCDVDSIKICIFSQVFVA